MSADPVPSDSNLLSLLDDNPDRAAEKYRALFKRLVKRFEWKRCEDPENLAAETLFRGYIEIGDGSRLRRPDPGIYLSGIANHVMLKDRDRTARQRHVPIEDEPNLTSVPFDPEAQIYFQQALDQLSPADRQLLIRYYTEDPTGLAAELGLEPGSLRVKVHRLKQRLIEWMRRQDSL